MNPKTKAHKGFTLLEVLVALVVMGLSLVTIFELFQGGLQALFASGQHTEAFIHARQKMEEIALEENQVEGQRQGIFKDGFRWELQVSPYPMPQIKKAEGGSQIPPLDVVELSARVFYRRMGRERSVELHTIQIVLPESKETMETKER